MIKKLIKSKNFLALFFLIITFSILFFYFNFYKFYSIYFEKRWQIIGDSVEKKNLEIAQKLDEGQIFFENEEYKFLKLPLTDNGFDYDEDYIFHFELDKEKKVRSLRTDLVEPSVDMERFEKSYK